MNIKINQKNYKVPEVDFNLLRKLGNRGYNIIKIVSDNDIVGMFSMTVSALADCDADEADRLSEQHFLGGGDVVSVVEGFIPKLSESAFFKALLKQEEETQKTEITVKQKANKQM